MKQKTRSFFAVILIIIMSLQLTGCTQVENFVAILKDEFLMEEYASDTRNTADSAYSQAENTSENEDAFAEGTATGDTSVADTSTESTTIENQQNTNQNDESKQTVLAVSTNCYAYTTLDDKTKLVYDEIYDAIMKHEEKVSVDTLDKAVLDQAYRAVTADHGGIFWVSGYVYTQYTQGNTLVGIDFAPKYTLTKGERDLVQTQIDGVTAQILSAVDMNGSDYAKAKYVFDYLASNIAYQAGAPDNQNIISVFINGATVCQGYASATQYLLEKLGIQSAIVTGNANGESHAWNLVRLDGEYYYIDTTWGNSFYSSDDAGMGKYINYNYFAVTSTELQQTHTANADIPLPACTATANNYYVREGKFIAEWNPDAIGAVLQNAYQTGTGMVSVKFATTELFEQSISYFISEQHILDYCNGITTLYYLLDDAQKVLTIKF